MTRVLVIVVLLSGLSLSYYYWHKEPGLPEYDRWYQMTWKGQDVGFMRQLATLAAKHYEIETITQVKTANQGVDFSFNERHVLRFSLEDELPLLSSYYRLDSPHHISESRLNKSSSGYQSWQIVNNKNTDQQIKDSFNLADFLAPQQWFESQPDLNSSARFKLLSAAEQQFTYTEYVVHAAYDDLLEITYRDGSETERKSMLVDDDGNVQAYHYNDIISLTRVADRDELTLSSNEDYYATQMIPLDKPLGDPLQWQSVRLGISHPTLAEKLSTSRRQFVADNQLQLTADISARKNEADIEHDLFTMDDPATLAILRKMAEGITSQYESPMQKITVLREYVANFIKDVPRIQSASVAELLASPEGDCTEHTTMFNALVTSLGYDARTVNGLVYLGDNFQGFGGHQWSEVLIEGFWVGFDPTWNINTLSASHIRFNQSLSEQFFNRAASDDGYEFTLLLRE